MQELDKNFMLGYHNKHKVKTFQILENNKNGEYTEVENIEGTSSVAEVRREEIGLHG